MVLALTHTTLAAPQPLKQKIGTQSHIPPPIPISNINRQSLKYPYGVLFSMHKSYRAAIRL